MEELIKRLIIKVKKDRFFLSRRLCFGVGRRDRVNVSRRCRIELRARRLVGRIRVAKFLSKPTTD